MKRLARAAILGLLGVWTLVLCPGSPAADDLGLDVAPAGSRLQEGTSVRLEPAAEMRLTVTPASRLAITIRTGFPSTPSGGSFTLRAGAFAHKPAQGPADGPGNDHHDGQPKPGVEWDVCGGKPGQVPDGSHADRPQGRAGRHAAEPTNGSGTPANRPPDGPAPGPRRRSHPGSP